MHTEKVIHRDIKPENIFLNDVKNILFRITPKLEILDAQFILKHLEIHKLEVLHMLVLSN